ncbi:hypothetical protein BOCO_0069 [Bombiscardovia coagulans]|uniref:Antitoxin SocA-like Panacea domain-containing protein n=1 Tax=Bombiscardovia coagulans TaxID=686666 RepID=A0A261EVK5_9BIFI|nr:hypothetical protein BOCO_0069 [Bombiscardovia coagulans]
MDFDGFEYRESMESVTGDNYSHKKMGSYPDVMDDVILSMKHNGLLNESEVSEFSCSYNPTVVFLSECDPDLSVFDINKYILNRIVKEYGNATGRELECKSHSEVPWLGVDNNERSPSELIFYHGTFNQIRDLNYCKVSGRCFVKTILVEKKLCHEYGS